MAVMSGKFPTITAGNAAVMELRQWIEGQRETARDELEQAEDPMKIGRLQGRSELLSELLAGIDPDRRPLRGVSSRLPKAS